RDEAEARSAPAVASDDARATAAVARTFLLSYLPYSYGRARAERIRAAAGRLMHELARTPPRVPAADARAGPRLISVRAEAALGDHAIAVLAVVDDGQRRYSVPLELQQTGGRWAVSAIGG